MRGGGEDPSRLDGPVMAWEDTVEPIPAATLGESAPASATPVDR